MSEFLAMGGYAAYVWGAYGVGALVLIGMVVATVVRRRETRRTLAAFEAARAARRERQA